MEANKDSDPYIWVLKFEIVTFLATRGTGTVPNMALVRLGTADKRTSELYALSYQI